MLEKEIVNKVFDDFSEYTDIFSMSMGPNGPIIRVEDDVKESLDSYLADLGELVLEEIYKEEYIGMCCEVYSQRKYMEE